MNKIIFSILALGWVSMRANAQFGEVPAAPPTQEVPKVEAYSNSSTTSRTVTKRREVTKNGKTEVFTESYSSSSPQQGYDDPQKSKSFSKSFGIGKGDKVSISNIYGSIIFKTWDRSEVKVDADIRAFANSDEEAQKLIDNISISATKSGDEATFKTNFEDQQGSNWGRTLTKGKKWRREVKIFMTVYLPSNVALTASQQYGNVELPDFSGPTSLKVQYGKITTGDLNNANNFISAQYTTVNLQHVTKATIKQQYGSGLTIASVGDLNLSAQYATVRIGDIKRNANIRQQYGSGLSIASVGGNLDLDAQYASVKVGAIKGDAGIKIQYGSGLNIEQVDNLSLTAQYAAVRVGRLTGNMTAKGQYGGRFSVEKVEATSKIVNIDADYLTVNLGFASNYGGNLNVDTYHAGFKAGENINAKRVGDDDDRGSSSKQYIGTIGRGGASNVKVSVKYNSATLRVN